MWPRCSNPTFHIGFLEVVGVCHVPTCFAFSKTFLAARALPCCRESGRVMVIYRGSERCYKAQTELRVFLNTGNCCRQGPSLVFFNPLPPQMSHSTSPYFCSFSVFFSLSSHRSLCLLFLCTHLNSSGLSQLSFSPALPLLDPTPSLQIPFFLLQTLPFLPVSCSALLALAQGNWDCFSEHCTIPLSPWLSVSSSGNIPAPLQVSNCCHCN